MDIIFKKKKLLKIVNSRKLAQKEFGKRGGDLLMRRLDELRACENLDTMRFFPAARCHELKGNLKGQFSVDLEHPYRLIFAPEEPFSYLPDGGLDWVSIKVIKIIDVEDTHDGKKKK